MATRNENLNILRNAMGSYSPGPKNTTQMNGQRYEETSRDESLRILQGALSRGSTAGTTSQSAGTAVNALQTNPSTATPQSASQTAPLTQGSLAGNTTVDSDGFTSKSGRFAGTGRSAEPLTVPNTNAERESLIRRMNEITANEGYATTVELADELTREQQEIRQRLHQLDEELGNAPQFYDSGERAGAVTKGALKQIGSAYTNFMGTLQGVGNRLHEASSAADQAVAGSDYAGWATDELTAANMAQAIMKENPDGNYLEGLQNEEQRLYEKADAMADSAAKDIEQAKEGLSALGQAGVDISVNLIQTGIDAAGRAAGLGMIPFFVRASGGAMQEARQAGASTGQQLAYGLTKGVIEVGTEKLFDGLAGVFGKGAADDVIEGLIGKLTNSDTGRTLLRAFAGATGEGTEEVISDLLDPFAKLIYNDQALKEAWENRADLRGQMLYDYLIGAALGGFGSVASIATGQNAEKNAKLAGVGTQEQTAEVQTGQEQTAEATPQSAVPADSSPYTGEPTTPQSVAEERATARVAPTAQTREAVESAPANAQQETQTQAAETADRLPKAELYNMRAGKNGWDKTYGTAQEALGEAVQYVDAELWNAIGKEIDNAEGNKQGFTPMTSAMIAVQEEVRQEQITPMQGAKLLSEIYKQGGAEALKTIYNPRTGNLYDKYIGQAKQYVFQKAAETAQEAKRATAGAETPPATQNAAQVDSGELNRQAETSTQLHETPVAQNASPVAQNAAGGTVIPGGSIGTGDSEHVLPYGAKMSQFWENTLQKTENAANAPESVKNPLWYMPKGEAQSLAEAASRLGADEQGTIENLVSAEAWSGVQTDAAAAVADTLYAEGARTGDYSSYAAWRKVMQNHITDTARGIQALAKYTRTGKGIAMDGVAKIQDSSLNPEQKTEAQNTVVKFGEDIDSAANNKDISGLREIILKMNDQRGTGTFVKGNFAKVLDKIEDIEYLGEYARRQLSAVASDYTASETRSFGEVLKTWQVNSQLTSLGTFFRNIGGNLTFGAIDSFSQNGFAYALDSLVSKKTGKRTVAADKGWFSSEARKQAIDAMNRSILEVAGDVDMGGSATRYGTTSGRTFKMIGGKAERFMSRWEQLLGYSLQTSDRLSRGQIEGAVQTGLEGLKNSGLSAEEISQIAESTADYRLFQNEGTAAKLSKGAHDVLNILGIGGQVNGVTRQGGFGVGDLVNPYPKVPANLGVKALEYSPANIIKGGIELVNVLKSTKNNTLDVTKQHQAVMDIARGLAGTPIIVLCAAMFKTGLIKNFDDEEDYDVQAQNAAEGKTGVQINLDAALRAFNGESTAWRDGDDLMSISWAEPLNAFMAIGSLIANEDDDATINTYIGDYFNGALQSVLDMPLMSNLSGAIDTVRYSTAESLGGQLAEGALDYAVSTATGFIPAPIRQTARAIDPYYRNTAGDNKVETAVNTLLNAIPGLRQTLDVKLDNFGQPKENAGGFAQRALSALVLPGAVNELNQSDASAAVEAIYEATGDAGVYPDRKAPNSISSGKNKHSLTAEEKQNYQAEAGQTSGKLISSLAESKYYDRMSDEQKAEVVKAINQYAEHKAADKVFDILGIDTKRDKWETLKGNDLISYLYVKELASGMYDDDGKITDYSAADKLIGQIKSGYGDLSTEAKDILKSSYGMLDDLIYGQENGVDSKTIYTAKERADANGNGSVTQEELWNYLETQVIMPSNKKSVLWDILTSGKTGYAECAEKHK